MAPSLFDGRRLDDQLQGYLDHLTIDRGVAANTLKLIPPRSAALFQHSPAAVVDDLGKVTESDVSDFLGRLRRGDPDTGEMRCRRCSAARR